MLTGERLGRYKIGQMIGAGGMGEVYIARDEQLDRDVALKVLLAEFCSQAERVNRFKFEAKAVSALNHPNIITIHEIAEIDEKLFIATEFIDGKTLRERIEAKDLDTYEIVKIAEQIADALAIAHEANIVHRDIKPENIMVRKDGYSKILDFGLAKPIFQGVSDKEDATLQLVKTQPGLVMGSVRYMSPEQARGKETDGRTDVWSLGVTLYEMLTGENPFDGETISDSLAAVIHKEPLPLKDVPKDLSWMIEKALNKSPDERYQSIRDFALDLRDMRLGLERDSAGHESLHTSKSVGLTKQDTSENKTLIHQTISADNPISTETKVENKTQVNTISIPQKPLYLPLAIISLIGVLALGGWFFAPALFGNAEVPFQSINLSRLTDNGDASRATVSPDGKMIVFVENSKGQARLLLRQVATGGTVELVPFTNKGFLIPRFSPDGEFIFYSIYDNGVGTLYRVPILGGESVEIVNDIDSYASFSPDGKSIAFKRHSVRVGGDEIVVITSEGKNPQTLAATKKMGFDNFQDLIWSSDGKKILLSGTMSSTDEYKKLKLVLLDVTSKELLEPEWLKSFLNEDWWFAFAFQWLDKSGLMFVGEKVKTDHKQIFHLSFDDGQIKKITNDLSDYDGLSVSQDGKTIVAAKVDLSAGLYSFNPQTKQSEEVIKADVKNHFWNSFWQMPNGRILYTKNLDGKSNIVSTDSEGADEKKLLTQMKHYYNPVITDDGKYLVYRATEGVGQTTIWRADTDGSNPIELTKKDVGYVSRLEVSPDLKSIYFSRERKDGGKHDVLKVSIDGGEVETVFKNNGKSQTDLEFSPDGKFAAYKESYFDPEEFKMNASILIVEYSENGLGRQLGEIPIKIDSKFAWSYDSKSLTVAKKEPTDSLWSVSFDSKKETKITELNKEFVQAFKWSNDGKKLLLAEGDMNSDLILIKDTGNSAK